MTDARSIIEKWPNAEIFASDLGLKRDSHGRVMKVRNRIPLAHWPKLLEAARVRGIDLSEGDLAQAHLEFSKS